MKNFFLLITFFALCACSASKSKSKTDGTSNNHRNEEQKDQSTDSNSQQLIHATLTVSFISKGSGIDSKAKNEFLNFLKQYSTKQSDTIEYKEVFWGREGEVDYCLFLHNLSQKNQERIVNEIRTNLKGSTLVRFIENAPCKKR